MTLIARIVPDKDNSGERLILAPRRAPLTLPTTEQEAPYHRRYDYTKLTDFDEARADGSTPTRLVTEDVVRDWFNSSSGWNEVCARIEEGHEAPGLAQRFFADECAAYTNRVEAA